MGWGWGRYGGYGRYGRAPKATKASAATLSTATLQRVLAQKQAEEQAQARWAVEQLRRERARIMSTGVTSYAWASKADRLLVPMNGALYVQDGVGEGASSTLRRLFDPADARWADVGDGPPLDAKLSADGKLVCFVWADEVCSVMMSPSDARRCIHGCARTFSIVYRWCGSSTSTRRSSDSGSRERPLGEAKEPRSTLRESSARVAPWKGKRPASIT